MMGRLGVSSVCYRWDVDQPQNTEHVLLWDVKAQVHCSEMSVLLFLVSNMYNCSGKLLVSRLLGLQSCANRPGTCTLLKPGWSHHHA